MRAGAAIGPTAWSEIWSISASASSSSAPSKPANEDGSKKQCSDTDHRDDGHNGDCDLLGGHIL